MKNLLPAFMCEFEYYRLIVNCKTSIFVPKPHNPGNVTFQKHSSLFKWNQKALKSKISYKTPRINNTNVCLIQIYIHDFALAGL